VEGLLPHFLMLHRMMRKTLALRIGYSEAIPAYERNLLDALMKIVRFDVFEYIEHIHQPIEILWLCSIYLVHD
jgi:hypothetical protein